jgi:hypothetical protein
MEKRQAFLFHSLILRARRKGVYFCRGITRLLSRLHVPRAGARGIEVASLRRPGQHNVHSCWVYQPTVPQ